MALPLSACALRSAEVGEPMQGTAPTDGGTFLLVRYPGHWARKALPGSELPEQVKRAFETAERESGGRVQLVRGAKRAEDRPEVYLAKAGSPVLRFAFSSYAAMAEIDWSTAACTGAHPDAVPLDRPLYLVCTHGKRDACCAALGGELFRAAFEQAPGRVLQSSHLGGHRFAATTITLPDGLCYGRLTAQEATAWVAARERGEIHDLSRLRGRSGWDGATQAAEVFLRTALSELRIDALAWEGTEAHDASDACVRFRVGAARHALVVRRQQTTGTRPASCGAEPEGFARYVWLDHHTR